MTRDWEPLPCGCWVGNEKVDGESRFLIRPCRLDCPAYVYALQETARQGKPVTFETRRDAS